MDEICSQFLGDRPKLKTYKDKNKPNAEKIIENILMFRANII